MTKNTKPAIKNFSLECGRNTGKIPCMEFDPRVRRYIIPKRIIWKTEKIADAVQNSEVLLEKRSGQITLNPDNSCIIRSTGDGAGILLDFGVEFHGSIQIFIWKCGAGKKPARIRVRFGESAMEAMSELYGDKNATNDHAMRDQIIEVWPLSAPEIGPSGLRFVRIDLLDSDSYIEIKSVRGIAIYRDIEYKGSFSCSDKRLNDIWLTGAYTVHLNMQEYLWDGIKRDRLVWIGDIHPETSTIQAVFGYNEVVPKSLDLIRNETPSPEWMNGISSYSMWWILIHYGWYMQNGDYKYLNEQKDYLAVILEMLLGCIGPDGMEQMPDLRFLDWPTYGNDEAVHAGLQSLLVMTLERGGVLSRILGERQLSQRCITGAECLRKHKPHMSGSKQAAALMALAGLADPVEINKGVLSVGGTQGMTTFMGYYILQARSMAKDINGSLDCIRKYWGGMLDMGATTFWEDFNLDWTINAARIDELVPSGMKDIHGDFGAHCYKGYRHSLCHGWASGPTAWLSEHILGVKIMEPGCRVVKIEPDLGDLEWVEGKYPTPEGVIEARHTRDTAGNVQSMINAPKGIQIMK